MSETQGTPTGQASAPAPGPTARTPRHAAPRSPAQPTGWVGWIVFAGMVLVLLGTFHAILGLVSLLKEEVFSIGENALLVGTSYDVWGWGHLVAGVAIVLVGLGLLAGQTWARVVAVVLAVLSALANITFITAYPLWSIVMIALNLLIIYALTVHGREMKNV